MLTGEEYEELKRRTRRRKLAASKVHRAKIILLSNQGDLSNEIAQGLGCHERTARRCIGRFNELARIIHKRLRGLPKERAIDLAPDVLMPDAAAPSSSVP